MVRPEYTSAKIMDALNTVLSSGNQISQISDGWTKMRQLFHMANPIVEAESREFLKLGIRRWIEPNTRHNQPVERFTDDQAQIAIVFPLKY